MSDRSAQVYVGFLPNHATMRDVETFFKGYGKVKSVNLKPGYGFVVFEDRRDAEDACRVIN
jgi:arginine/serine-rich splicing factor 4/5/6